MGTDPKLSTVQRLIHFGVLDDLQHFIRTVGLQEVLAIFRIQHDPAHASHDLQMLAHSRGQEQEEEFCRVFIDRSIRNASRMPAKNDHRFGDQSYQGVAAVREGDSIAHACAAQLLPVNQSAKKELLFFGLILQFRHLGNKFQQEVGFVNGFEIELNGVRTDQIAYSKAAVMWQNHIHNAKILPPLLEEVKPITEQF